MGRLKAGERMAYERRTPSKAAEIVQVVPLRGRNT